MRVTVYVHGQAAYDAEVVPIADHVAALEEKDAEIEAIKQAWRQSDTNANRAFVEVCAAATARRQELEERIIGLEDRAARYLREWRLRDSDVDRAEFAADEADAAKEMWRGRACRAEGKLLGLRMAQAIDNTARAAVGQ